MSLLSLPPDMLRLVLGKVNVRSLLMAACTCKALRALAAELPLHPVMTSQTHMLDWLAKSHVAPRVHSLTSRYSMWGRCTFVRWLTSLESLVVTFGHVSAPIFRWLPASLTYLDIHRLDCEFGEAFFTSRLSRLVNLQTLKLTFTSHWDMVVVEGLDALPLKHLSLRLAPSMVVRAPLRVPTLNLHAVSHLICPHELAAEDLRLECCDGSASFDLMITPESAGCLRRLSLSCPNRITVPRLDHMTRLEHIHVKFDSVLVPLRHLSAMPRLHSAEFDTRFGVAVAGMQCKLPRTVVVRGSVAGIPLRPSAIDAMFYTLNQSKH